MTRQVQQLPIARVHCRPQVREAFDQVSIEGLARSLAQVGQQQPILVTKDGERFVVVDGERRLRAARSLGWPMIDAVVEDAALSDVEVIQRQLVCNLQRDDLLPCERARGMDRLIRESGWDAKRVADELGLSEATVSKSLALLVLPMDAQQLIDNNQLAASTGYEIAKIRDAKERARLLELAAQGSLTRAAVTRAQRGDPKPRKRRRTPMARPETFLVGLDAGVSVIVLGPKLSVRSIVDAVRAAEARLGALPSTDVSIKDAVRLLANRPKPDAREAA